MDLDYYLYLYKENGYIMELRKHVGHATIMCAVGGVIIENEKMKYYCRNAEITIAGE